MSTTITTAHDQDAAAAVAVARQAYRRQHPRPTVTGDVTCPACDAEPRKSCTGPGRERRPGSGGAASVHTERRVALAEAGAAWQSGLSALHQPHHGTETRP